MKTHRGIATVLFTDIVGSTQRAADLGDREWRQLLARHHDLVRRALARHGGREVSTAGDGFVAVFDSTERGIQCAIDIRDQVPELGLQVRCGLHVGTIEHQSDGDIGGITVHVGARVAALAEPGQVAVTRGVRDAELGSDFVFEEQGSYELKGVPGRWLLYTVSRAPAAAAATGGGTPDRPPMRGARIARLGAPLPAAMVTAALVLIAAVGWWALRDRDGGLEPATVLAETAAPGIAIVPFNVNDPELSTWREGMVDLLATNLDGVGGLRAINSRTVLSRWHARVAEGETPDLPTTLDIAREAGARYSIVGSIVAGANTMRVVTDIYDLEADQSLGQDQVEGVPDSIFRLVDDLSIRILARVLERESPTAGVDLARVTTRSVTALKSFLEGEALSRSSSFAEAIPAYQEAVEADSTFALAYYRMSWAQGWVESILGTEPRTSLERAIRFEERLPQRERDFVHVSEAYYDGRPDATELAVAATERYPDDPFAWLLLGEVRFHLPFQSLATRADKDAAFGRTIRLDPTFTPAYIHALDNAFLHSDRPAADSLLARYRQRAKGTEYDRKYETAYALVFGDSLTKAGAIRNLETVPTTEVGRVITVLLHPSATAVRRQVIDEWQTRPDSGGGPTAFYIPLVRTLEGRTDAALDAALALDQPELHLQLLLGFSYFGYEADFDSLLAAAPRPEPWAPSEYVFADALLALESGHTARSDSLSALALAWAETMKADSATAAADIAAGVAILDARRAMLEDRPQEALALLEPIVRAGNNAFFIFGWMIGLLESVEGPDEAIRFAEVIGPNPWIGAQTAALYEQVGDIDRAIEAYGWVTLSWQGADEWLQPHVAEARRQIARLRGLQRG